MIKMKYLILVGFLLLVLVGFAFAQENSLEIIKPAEKSIEKNQELEFEVKINTDSENTIGRVYVNSHGIDLDQIELEKNSAGNYEGSVFIDYRTGDSGGFEIIAELNHQTGQSGDLRKNPNIRIESAEIDFDFELIPEGPYYLNSKIEKIKLNASYPNGTKLTAEDLEDVEFSIGMERQFLEFKTEGETGSLIADLNFELSFSQNMRGDAITYETRIYNLRDK